MKERDHHIEKEGIENILMILEEYGVQDILAIVVIPYENC